MEKQVLIEYLPFKPLPRQLQEARMNPKAPLIVAGLVQAADKPNANKRIYDYNTLAKQVQLYIDGPIKERRALGELDHPESSVINLKNVCHNITRLWWEGKNLMGEFEVLDTPSGNILRELFLNNITVGVSSRAMGSVTPIGEGLVQVEDDLELIGWDFVSTPSTYGAYVYPTPESKARLGLREGVDYRTAADPYAKVSGLISEIICTQAGTCCLK